MPTLVLPVFIFGLLTLVRVQSAGGGRRARARLVERQRLLRGRGGRGGNVERLGDNGVTQLVAGEARDAPADALRRVTEADDGALRHQAVDGFVKNAVGDEHREAERVAILGFNLADFLAEEVGCASAEMFLDE